MNSLEFYSYNLNEMHKGSVNLGVPLLDEVIQIAAGDVNGKTRLEVEKNKTGIYIAREDHEPIKVCVRETTTTDEFPWFKVNEYSPFKDEVDQIQIVPADEERMWVLDQDETPVEDVHALKEFLSVVGDYAIRKQQGTYLRLRAAKKIRRLIIGRPDPFA